MKVAQLSESVQGSERSITTTLGKLSVSSDGAKLVLDDNDAWPIDIQAEAALGTHLGINKSYLAKCPGTLKADNLNFWISSRPEADVVLEVNDYGLISVHSPDRLHIPLNGVVDVLQKVCDPSWEVANLHRDEKMFVVDILTPHTVEVPGDNRIEGRPKVGDITHGGMRVTSGHVMSAPCDSIVPSVSSYLMRLWCTNGSCSREREGTVTLKGKTVPEVLAELEEKAEEVLSSLDDRLADYAAMAGVPVPGHPVAFAHQLCQEHGIPARVMRKILDQVALLPEDVSVYDIQQVITEVANGDVRFETRRLLQRLGGDLAFHTEELIHRCSQCERIL